MAGRRPVPTALKELRGNAGHRPVNKNEPKPLAQAPRCPEHLDEEARREWHRIAPQLMLLRVLAKVDRAALAGYCMSWSRWVAAEKQLVKFGMVIKSPNGYPIQNPYLSIANAALASMTRTSIEFGMTPSSRSRISALDAIGAGESSDPWDNLDAPVVEGVVTGTTKVN